MPTQGEDYPLGTAHTGGGVEGSLGNHMILKKGSDHPMKRSSSFKKVLNKAIVTNKTVQTLFKTKSKKPKPPVEVINRAFLLLSYLQSSDEHAHGHKHQDKVKELSALISEMKLILYGTSESEPVAEACTQLTQEFFKYDTLRLLISCLPKLDLEARKDATQVVANLQRQYVNSRLIASNYLENNLDLLDHLIVGYEDPSLGLHYGGMLRECIRHQVVASYVLNSEHMKKLFDYIQLPNFDVAADAISTFTGLMTRHKSTVAEFLSKNYSWFFDEFNSKLLMSQNYITRRQAIKLLGDMLLDRSNSGTMVRYVSNKENLKILMNLLRDQSKSIQIDAFHVFKLFVANQNKPKEIVRILYNNSGKLLRFFENFKTDKEDEVFEADKAQVVKEIAELEQCPHSNSSSGELFCFQ